ncbi:MAG: hypothetical protein ACYC0E_04495, partial [Acidimicrobiales bacterium]
MALAELPGAQPARALLSIVEAPAVCRRGGCRSPAVPAGPEDDKSAGLCAVHADQQARLRARVA